MTIRFTLVLLLAVVTAPAATFYCDPVNGSPQGNGSAEHPWRTIEEVLQGRLIQLCDSHGKPANPNAPVKPGDTVLLRSGWHGSIRIPSGYNDQPITIAAAPGHTPQVGWIEIGEGRNWVLRGLTVSPSLAPSPLSRVPRHLVMLGEDGGEESADLVVEDCFIYSVLDTTGWTAKDWVEKPASGIWLGRHGKHHVARNNYVLNTRFGINLCAPDCVAEGNVVANFSADGMRMTRDGQVIQYNVIKNNFVGARDGDDNHDDGIQIFLFNAGTGTVRNGILRGNIIIARETDGLPFPNGLQGIGGFDGPLVHFLVESNVVCVNHFHGISLYDAQGCTIQGNTCFSRWPDPARPWVMLGQKKHQAAGNTVRDNLAHSFNFKADAEVKADNNVVVTEAVFNQKLAALAAFIDGRFGHRHPTAKRPRLESKPEQARLAPPYPHSPVIESITWHWDTYTTAAPGSDLWPVAWGPDDRLYAAWGDGGGFGGSDSDGRVAMGFARIEGQPEHWRGVNVNGGKNPEHSASFLRKGKTTGIAFVDGVLYATVNLEDGTWPAVNHALAWSTNQGATWTRAEWLSPKGEENFQPAKFLTFGKDYTGVPDPLAGYVYLYGPKQSPERGSGNQLYLARVPRTKLRERDAYEFFQRLDAAGVPVWGPDSAQAQPVFTDPNGVTPGSVVYEPALKRFLLTCFHVGPGQLGLFDAPNPWGPWATIAYYEDWGQMGVDGEGLTCGFPQKWISADGLTLWSIFSVYGDGAKKGIKAHDKFNLLKATLQLRAQKSQ